jgi:hypothetical protein
MQTYLEYLEGLISAYKAAISPTAGTCDEATIRKLVGWVVREDPEARQKFGDAVRDGAVPYEALLDRLEDHDDHAHSLITKCKAEALMALAAEGFGGG